MAGPYEVAVARTGVQIPIQIPEVQTPAIMLFLLYQRLWLVLCVGVFRPRVSSCTPHGGGRMARHARIVYISDCRVVTGPSSSGELVAKSVGEAPKMAARASTAAPQVRRAR